MIACKGSFADILHRCPLHVVYRAGEFEHRVLAPLIGEHEAYMLEFIHFDTQRQCIWNVTYRHFLKVAFLYTIP